MRSDERVRQSRSLGRHAKAVANVPFQSSVHCFDVAGSGGQDSAIIMAAAMQGAAEAAYHMQPAFISAAELAAA